MTTGWAQIPDDDAEQLLKLMAAHGPAKYGWCRCGSPWARCGRQAEFEVQLAIAARLPLDPPWTLQPEEGSWRDQG